MCSQSYTDNTMSADALATLGARASADMVLTPKPEYSISSIRRIFLFIYLFFCFFSIRRINITVCCGVGSYEVTLYDLIVPNVT